MSDVDPANVMRNRREVVIGVSFEAMSPSASGVAWAADFMGWPPQPVC